MVDKYMYVLNMLSSKNKGIIVISIINVSVHQYFLCTDQTQVRLKLTFVTNST